ncbi:MAG TPA: helix-turn-helix domain-containing protein [Methylophilaceae bacterium]|nr:helix-turn-helix domain-containing protein [Methylophilaceae bacterium]
MSDSMDDMPEVPAAESLMLGPRLEQTREAAGLTREDVSNRLRLSPRQIKALESDDFTVLPEAMITRGFIRNYARLLELDPEPLLEAYRAHVPSEPPRSISIPSENILISENGGRPWTVYLLAFLLIALLLGVWLYMGEMPGKAAQKSAPVAVTPAPVQDPVSEPMPVPALPAAERAEEVSPTPAESPAAAPGNDSAAAAEAAASAAASTNSAVSNEQPAAGTGSTARLKFTFSDASWVSVVDGNNQEILNKTKPAGSEEVVEGKPPFKVVIGNVTGSKLVYNDKPVDLEPHTRLNVARITLE